MPSMSWPRCRGASKISDVSGNSRSSSSSQSSINRCARTTASSTSLSLGIYDPGAVPDVLIYSDTIRSPELRHELPLGVPDPFLYVERDGTRHVVLTSFEIDRVRAVPGAPEPHAYEEFGYDDLIAQGLPRDEVLLEVAVNATRALGVTQALVPWTFPVRLSDRLRETGVTLNPELDFFQDRRRVKSDTELAGIRRAQRAAEAGMDAARALLRRAEPNGAGLGVEGESLTAERIKAG